MEPAMLIDECFVDGPKGDVDRPKVYSVSDNTFDAFFFTAIRLEGCYQQDSEKVGYRAPWYCHTINVQVSFF